MIELLQQIAAFWKAVAIAAWWLCLALMAVAGCIGAGRVILHRPTPDDKPADKKELEP